MPKNLLKMVDIVKEFPGVKALNNAYLELDAGEVVGLVGENGAGKSTLMNVLGGIYKPDGGRIYIDGEEAAIHGVLDAQVKGIAFIHQELALEMHLSVAENIFLGRELKNKLGFVSQRRMNHEAKKFLDIVGLNIEPSTKVIHLSTGQQQMLEIAKAFSLNARIIVMDEPTSSLSEKEVEILFKTIKELKKREIGIIYISHKLSEIFELAEKVVVMRDGSYITTKKTKETDIDELVSLMVGRELERYYVRTFNEPGGVLMDVKNLSSGTMVKDCSFSVRRGEILGFYGLVGAGRSELMQAIMGLDPNGGGEVEIKGKAIGKLKPAKIQRERIALVPENRKTQGLILGNTVKFNVTLAVLGKFIKNLRVNRNAEIHIADESVEKLAIKTPSISQRVANLSGGNQQKVVLAKWLHTSPEILIMDEPTRGIDVGAKAEIYSIMNDLVQGGMGIIMVSSELNEILNMCDRLIIMNGGRIVAEMDRKEFDQNLILHYALGGY
jgi:ribose transport system ATP-binding protein